MADRVTVLNTEMNKEMLEYAVETTREAFEKYNVETQVAEFIKKRLDEKYARSWHCVVGTWYGRRAKEIRWFVCELQSLDPQSFRYD
ncbi:dynein light chain 2 cytoplasmic [Clonorchis sinensis]|uniref:Dynein light chain n=1 Tax=Clonorchis sinensis TaxID=79923 RepID=G7YFD9_CLOSI|nr:dynein light chain 2 cytoplasmic [Clonorchis sinensis]